MTEPTPPGRPPIAPGKPPTIAKSVQAVTPRDIKKPNRAVPGLMPVTK